VTEHDLIDAPPHPVAGDSALQSQTLESVVSAYNYHAWLRHLAMPYLGSHPLELGSGLGDYAQAYLDAGIPRITVSEADPVRLAMLRRRFESQPRIAMLQLDLRAAPKREHSSAVAFNVLE
jgi:16S rRNA A1518/A1519 N6-dimethyltransferase RsmA/KsgA/DIM1 with predicted DNA glycosylase/AP lyase activity